MIKLSNLKVANPRPLNSLQIMLEWIESQWKIEKAHQDGEPYTRMKFEADSNKVENKLKQFITTEQVTLLESMLSEIEKIKKVWSHEEMPSLESYHSMNAYNQALDDVIAKVLSKLQEYKV